MVRVHEKTEVERCTICASDFPCASLWLQVTGHDHQEVLHRTAPIETQIAVEGCKSYELGLAGIEGNQFPLLLTLNGSVLKLGCPQAKVYTARVTSRLNLDNVPQDACRVKSWSTSGVSTSSCPTLP